MDVVVLPSRFVVVVVTVDDPSVLVFVVSAVVEPSATGVVTVVLPSVLVVVVDVEPSALSLVVTVEVPMQQFAASQAPVQAGALVQSDRRIMLAATHRSDENAKPDPSVSAHVRSTSQQSITPQVPVAHVIARSLLMVYPEPQTPMAVPLPSMLSHDGLASQQSDGAQDLVAHVTERSPFKWLTPLMHDENEMPLPVPAPCPSVLSHVGSTQQHSATVQPSAPH